MEWLIRPLDTLFFRGPEPFNAGETSYLRSLFPPTPETVQGFVRSHLLETWCRDLDLYGRGQCARCPIVSECQVRSVVGTPSGQEGTLLITGLYLFRTKESGGREGKPASAEGTSSDAALPIERLYPCPGDLRVRTETKPVTYLQLAPGRPVRCDMGLVCLPDVPAGQTDPKEMLWKYPPQWITGEGLASYRAGRELTESDFVRTNDLLEFEPRVGIGRDLSRHAVGEGLLYSIELLRFRRGCGIAVALDGQDEDGRARLRQLGEPLPRLCRFGGEGRLIELTAREVGKSAGPPVRDEEGQREVLATVRQTGRFRLVLLTPADFNGSWLPPGFELVPGSTRNGQVTFWRGRLGQTPVRIFVSCGGEPVPIGGWDIAQRQDKPLRWCVPAGTVYYCQLENPEKDPARELLETIDSGAIGSGSRAGFGRAVLAPWTEPFDPSLEQTGA